MDDIVFELRRRLKGVNFTYGDLYYNGKLIASTLEQNSMGGQSAILAKEYPIIWLDGIFGCRIYLKQVDDKGKPFINIRGSVLVGKKTSRTFFSLHKKTLIKVREIYDNWLKEHPTCKNGKINIIDYF